MASGAYQRFSVAGYLRCRRYGDPAIEDLERQIRIFAEKRNFSLTTIYRDEGELARVGAQPSLIHAIRQIEQRNFTYLIIPTWHYLARRPDLEHYSSCPSKANSSQSTRVPSPGLLRRLRHENGFRDLLGNHGHTVEFSGEARQIRQDTAVLPDVRVRHVVQDRDQCGLVQQCAQLPLGPEASGQVDRRQQRDPSACASQSLIHLQGHALAGLDGKLVVPHRYAELCQGVTERLSDFRPVEPCVAQEDVVVALVLLESGFLNLIDVPLLLNGVSHSPGSRSCRELLVEAVDDMFIVPIRRLRSPVVVRDDPLVVLVNLPNEASPRTAEVVAGLVGDVAAG